MNLKILFSIQFLLLAFSFFGAEPQELKVTKELIFEISNVKLICLKTYPQKIRIEAFGMVPTSGWKNPLLKQDVYLTPPIDGIYDFFFMAQKPDDVTLQVITPIKAVTTITIPNGIKGVRIHSATNEITKLLNEN